MATKRYAEGRVYRAFREGRYVCVGGRGKERGRRVKGMSPECVTFQPSAGYCVYLLLSPAEMRSEVLAAVVCYLRYNKGDEGMRDDTHLGQHHRDKHLKSHMWNAAHMKHVHDRKAPWLWGLTSVSLKPDTYSDMFELKLSIAFSLLHFLVIY